MKTQIVLTIFSVFLLIGFAYPAAGQLDLIADHVVINEIDINPPGDDSKSISEWIELYNPTDSEVDIGGWEIGSTTVLKKTLTIPVGTIIQPGGFQTFSYQTIWFTDVSELVELRDANANVIDQTPSITDVYNDFSSWQRKFDGYDTDSSNDWKFVQSNAGSSNGQLGTVQSLEEITVSISTDKSEYLFGEQASISGYVSELVFNQKPSFNQEPVLISISGPNYEKTISLYPDGDLVYETELNLQQVLGIIGGIYDVTVSYEEGSADTQFTVGTEVVIQEKKEESVLTITTDKESYIPGQTATISASTTEIVQFEGLKFSVNNPNGNQIYSGNLFPDIAGNQESLRGGSLNADPGALFATTIFITTVEPVYGIYEIIGEYSSQKARTTFEVVKDIKEGKKISLSTDKNAYGLGDTVIISGRLNSLWIPTLDLEIIQVGIVSLDTGTQDLLKVLDAVRLEGDSTFSYELQIPNDPERLGDYKVRVSKEIGEESLFFKVMEDPESFVATSVRFSIQADKPLYDLGETVHISGNVANPTPRTSFETPVVTIFIKDEDGKSLTIDALKKEIRVRVHDPLIAAYTFTAIPDLVGNFEVKVPLTRSIFEPGTYEIDANFDGRYFAQYFFDVEDSLNIGDASIIATLDKEVYGLGEEVKLTGMVGLQSAENTLAITLTKPDGDRDNFGAIIDSSLFSWSWKTPSFEIEHIDLSDPRSILSSNFGTYVVTIKTSSATKQLLFKVSPNPEEDVLIKAMQVSTDKSGYTVGDHLTVSGNVIPRLQGTEGLVVPDRVNISITTTLNKQIYDAAVYPDSSGQFHSSFVLPPGVFVDGTYKVTATYSGERAQTVFLVSSDFVFSDVEGVHLIVEIGKDEYHPGEIVKLVGRPNILLFLQEVKIVVLPEELLGITCGSFTCGEALPITQIIPDETSTFTFEYQIPDERDSLGKYVIKVSSEFDIVYQEFIVVEEPEPEEPMVPETVGKVVTKKTIEKFNRIAESFIPISVNSKLIDEKEASPRVIQGTLITPKRGEEPNVNIRVSTEDGTCIIGQDPDCMISKSTRVPGGIYQIIELDGLDYKIRYSGPDSRLEKFTILPESSDAVLGDSTFNVEVIKGDQPSRFYYKVSYISTE